MARLFADENFPLPVVEELRRLGHNVLTMQETGQANQEVPDEAVLALASSYDRAVLTINRKDFIRLHHQEASHGGIIACTADINFAGQARRIHETIENRSSIAGALIRVNKPPS